MDSMISITQHKLNEDAFTDGALKLWNDWMAGKSCYQGY